MNNYLEFKEMQETKANKVIGDKLFIAFGLTKEEVTNELTKQGADINTVIGLGAGTYVQEADYDDVMKFFNQLGKENHDYTLNNIYEVCKYEFANHELEISLSYNYDSFLTEVLDLTDEEIRDNIDEIKRAIKDYKTEFYECN